MILRSGKVGRRQDFVSFYKKKFQKNFFFLFLNVRIKVIVCFMKKILLIIFLVFVLSGCSGNNFLYLEKSDGNLLKLKKAETKQEKIIGLSGKLALTDFSGMIFFEKNPKRVNYWMKGMLFPLDFVFLDEEKKVVEINYDIPVCDENKCPMISSKSDKIFYVIEFPAGKAKEYGIEENLILKW